MRYFLAGICALACVAAEAGPVAAAWNNVFQPTLFHSRRSTSASSPAVAYSVPVVAASPTACCTPAPAPQPACNQCTTTYTQRCYYQPVTTYQSQSYYEPVTTYSTSYYYEPVTSYRYSYYYDSCTCTYQQVATPCTSYQLKAKSCPVQSWVQRCAQVPVTTYQKSCYLQPQTTCCQTTQGALIPVAATAPVVAAPVPTTPPAVVPVPATPPASSPPVIQENRSPGTPPPPASYDRYYPPSGQQQTPPPPQNNTSWVPASPPPATPFAPATPPAKVKAPLPPPPAVKLDRIVFGDDASVEGQIVRSDNTPRPETKVMFVSVDRPDVQQTVTTNGAGRFAVNLAPGGWMVYLHALDGNPIFHSRIDVGNQPTQIRLVNR